MPDVATTLKQEIARLSRKEVRAVVNPLKKQVQELREAIRDQKQTIAQLEKTVARLSVLAPVEDATPSPAPDETVKVRMTPASIKKLRQRLRLSQRQLGLLMGASTNSVLRWEAGKSAPRQANKAAFATLRRIGVREAKQRLAELEEGK